jgi:hypothetical protein
MTLLPIRNQLETVESRLTVKINVEMSRSFLDRTPRHPIETFSTFPTPKHLDKLSAVDGLPNGFHHQFVGGNSFGVVDERSEVGVGSFLHGL